MADRPLSAVVLAAGEGTRMRSERPKPLHLLCGQAMVRYVLGSLGECDVDRVVVVVGHGAERVTKKLQSEEPDLVLDFVEQHRQQGTGDAVAVGLTAFEDDDADDEGPDVLVLPGDTPLLRPSTIRDLVEHHRRTGAACTVLTAHLADATGYGRVLRGRDDRVVGIVEHRDADAEQRLISEVNTSIYCFRRDLLAPALRRVRPDNDQGEYYLTDVVEVLHSAGYLVTALPADDPEETHGVNDRAQLAAAEAELRRRTNLDWLKRGVTMVDPDRTYVDTTVDLATDVTLFPGTILQGCTVIGQGCEIGPDTRLVDCVVGARTTVEQATARDAEIGADAHVGPYATIAPGEVVPDGTRTGPFFALPSPT